MTFFSGIVPLWMLTLGPLYLSGDIMITMLDIFVSITSAVGLLLMGIGLRRCSRKVGLWAKQALVPFSAFLLLACVILGSFVHRYVFWDYMQDSGPILSALFLPWITSLISGLLILLSFQSKCPKQEGQDYQSLTDTSTWQHIKTVAIETALPHSLLALLLLRNSLPQPEADLAAVTPFLSLLFAQLPFCLLAALLGGLGMLQPIQDSEEVGQPDPDVKGQEHSTISRDNSMYMQMNYVNNVLNNARCGQEKNEQRESQSNTNTD